MNINQQKRAVIEALLPLCPFIEVKAQHALAALPVQLTTLPRLVLRIGRDPNVLGMPDLVIDDNGFTATISIQGQRHLISIGWPTVCKTWIAQEYEGPLVVWPQDQREDVPEVKKPGLRLV